MGEMWRTFETSQMHGIHQLFGRAGGSEGAMKMLGEANVALVPSAILKDDLHSCKGLVGRVPVVLHPSLYRAVKLTFPPDIGGDPQCLVEKLVLRTEPSRRSHHK